MTIFLIDFAMRKTYTARVEADTITEAVDKLHAGQYTEKEHLFTRWDEVVGWSREGHPRWTPIEDTPDDY